jgi:hypothetical protein
MGAWGEMNQALYAHMNNKRKKNIQHEQVGFIQGM